jgi:hypothetical protein
MGASCIELQQYKSATQQCLTRVMLYGQQTFNYVFTNCKGCL